MKDKLIQSSSKEALQQNIKTEIESGKDPKQAAAIAYSVQKANDAGSSAEKMAQVEYDKLKKELSQLQKEYDEAENNPNKQNRIQQSIDSVYNKLNKIKKEWSYCLTDSKKRLNIIDGYTGEIRNISGKQFKGADGKIYEMPNYTYAMYSPEQNAYYGFKNQNNMPYAPVGGKSALQQILGSGGFISLDGMIFVKPIRDANSVLREYSKFENGKLETAQLIKHNNRYTLISSNPKNDKYSDSLQQIESYIKSIGYKPVY